MTRIQEGLEAVRSRLEEQVEPSQLPQRREANVSEAERWTSLAVGSFLSLLGLSRRGIPGLIIGGIGADLIYRGATGYCHFYGALGVDTARDEIRQEDYAHRGIHVRQSCLINRPIYEVYQYWRDFQNLSRIMPHLESIQPVDDKVSHWVAKAPTIAGRKVEWDAEITADEPNSLIAWRSLPGADVDNSGSVRFVDRGDRGTMVHVTFDYIAPAGQLGKWVAKLVGQEPEQQVQEGLRNFKRMMETGELATIEGQPRGTCTGKGRRSYNQ